MQNAKKKKVITAILTGFLMTAMAGVGVTFAVLTADTEKRVNNFTFGNVKIDLKEEEWKELSPEDKIVYPGKNIKKDPVIENTGNNDLYAFIEVHVPIKNVRTYSNDDKSKINNAAPTELFTLNNINADWTEIDSYYINIDESGNEIRLDYEEISGTDLYYVHIYAYNTPVPKGESTEKLFDSVKYANVLEGELEMGEILEMPLTAYAIQSDYVESDESDLTNKLKKAFEKYALIKEG